MLLRHDVHDATPSTMSIKSLPQDDIDKIKSSVAITTLNGVIDGLLRNSLDASATTVYLNLDYAKGNCTLLDNGDGIPPQEFGDTGGLCKLHRKSLQELVARREKVINNLPQTPRGNHTVWMFMGEGGIFLQLWLVSLYSLSHRNTSTTDPRMRSSSTTDKCSLGDVLRVLSSKSQLSSTALG